jgi:hypothetical protein
MIQPEMLAHPDLHSGHEHSINIPRIPLPLRVTVFVRLVNETHRHTALNRSDRHVGKPLVGNPIHDDVDLLRLRIHIESGAAGEILDAVWARWKI